MKNKKAFFIISFIAIIISLVNILFFMKDMFFYNTAGSESMKNLPSGKFMYSSISNYNENQVVKTYVVNEKGVGKAVRAEIMNAENKMSRTLYWQSGTTNIKVSWDSENTVVINGHKINVVDGYYDSRGRR